MSVILIIVGAVFLWQIETRIYKQGLTIKTSVQGRYV